MTPALSPIEKESFAIIAREADLSRFGPMGREVAARIVHSTGDIGITADLYLPEAAVEAGVAALAAGAQLIVDVRMLAAGIPRYPSITAIDLAPGTPAGQTRSHQGMRSALLAQPSGAIVAVGSAPTALQAVLELAEERVPRLVAGFPVGFVGATEAKEALCASPLPAVSCLSRRGGSPMAAAAINAMLLMSRGEYRLAR